ncbi:c-type cytochrome [bacterium]|nr:c-type cytochrome [bacterium]
MKFPLKSSPFSSVLFTCLTIVFFSASCRRTDVCPTCNGTTKDSLTPWEFGLRPQFADIDTSFDSTPKDNPTTVEGADLGRYLFYDVRLSANNTVACASCHKQEYAFADNVQFSKGFDGGHTARNSMSIVNMRWQKKFFWDGRANSLEEQALMPIQDHIEMGMNLDDLVPKLQAIDIYPPKFEAAFGSSKVTADRIGKAIAQFVRTIVSQNSKFDDAFGMPEGKVKHLLTDEEFLGYKLFIKHINPDNGSGKNMPGTANRGANCGDCHKTALMTNSMFTSNGLDSVTTDPGYGKISGLPQFDGTFKTPTLRNIELTAPYMHDGRFNTLEEVIEHYDSHVQDHPNLDVQISAAGNNFPGRLDLTDEEKRALVAFLKTLTDHQLITDPKYASPF